MLEVKAIHHDGTGGAREIASMSITSDGTGDAEADLGNYDVLASVVMPPPLRATFHFKGKVKNHDRHSGVWQLVAKAIKGLKV